MKVNPGQVTTQAPAEAAPRKELPQLSAGSAPGQMERDEMEARSAAHRAQSSSRTAGVAVTIALGLLGAGALAVGMPLLGAGLLFGGILISPSARPFE
ncbi:MAG: hypothetical protein IT381_14285 [Deltaproteobacteria bacterium]|nr:hypothetical protein [Deltaproteobacteria bacterium]